jgi:hypothetical protein
MPIDMPDANHTIFRDDDPAPLRKSECATRRGALKGSLARFALTAFRQCLTGTVLGAAAFLLCHCHRQSPAPTPTPTPPSTVISSPSAPATVTPTPTLTPTPTPVATPTPSASPLPTPSPTPDPFAEGMKQLLEASGKGFLEWRGKFKKTENGSGPDPLFRVRKIYEGTFLFGGATNAELEEVYFSAEQRPAYNYHLYYRVLSARNSIERYDDLRLNLNRVLQGFEHTFGDRYDAWARDDPLKTAILLSSQDAAGTPEIQVHVAFSSPQW